MSVILLDKANLLASSEARRTAMTGVNVEEYDTCINIITLYHGKGVKLINGSIAKTNKVISDDEVEKFIDMIYLFYGHKNNKYDLLLWYIASKQAEQVNNEISFEDFDRWQLEHHILRTEMYDEHYHVNLSCFDGKYMVESVLKDDSMVEDIEPFIRKWLSGFEHGLCENADYTIKLQMKDVGKFELLEITSNNKTLTKAQQNYFIDQWTYDGHMTEKLFDKPGEVEIMVTYDDGEYEVKQIKFQNYIIPKANHDLFIAQWLAQWKVQNPPQGDYNLCIKKVKGKKYQVNNVVFNHNNILEDSEKASLISHLYEEYLQDNLYFKSASQKKRQRNS